VEENLEHLLVKCRITQAAIRQIIAEAKGEDRSRLNYLQRAKIQDHELRTHCMRKDNLLLSVMLSRAVWRARWDCMGSRLTDRERQGQVVLQFQKAGQWAKGGGWRRRDREVEVHDFEEMRSALPSAHHAYTDGSAFKYTDHQHLVETRGPSGCGAYVVLQEGQELFRSQHLGVGTNAMAEVQGMIVAARLFLENEPEDVKPLFFFTDNRAAIKAATGAKTPWWCVEEAKTLREVILEISRTRRVVCFWVPSHGGVRENEVADRLARRGATGVDSDERASPTDVFDIPQAELVVQTALGQRDVTRPVPLSGLGGVLREWEPARTKRTIGDICRVDGNSEDRLLRAGGGDAPT
jgi:ribonuclease HI